MLYTLVIALVVLSGFLAYFGDLLGRKMGKKRLTLFHLRPKHTAIIVTTITGMLISVLVLTTLLTVDTGLRKMLTQGKEILRQNNNYKAQNTSLSKNNKLLASRGEYLQLQVAKQQKEVDDAHKDVVKATAARNVAVKSVSRLEKEITLRQEELQQMKVISTKTEKELKDKTAKLTLAEYSLKNIQQELSTARNNLNTTETKLQSAILKLSDTQNKLSETQVKLRLTEETVKDKEVIIAAKQEMIHENENIIKKQQTQMLELKKQKDDQFFDFRSKDLIIGQGDEVARGVISPQQSKFAIQVALYSLLDQASDNASKMGAGTGNNGRSVKLVPSRFVADTTFNGISLDTQVESACVGMVADAVYGSFDNWLVQLVCVRNSLAGEQLQVEPRLYRNRLVYRKGDFIASTNLNGSPTEGPVLLSVIKFLQNDVSKAGIKAGIVPIDMQNNPGQNPQHQLDSLLIVVDRIRSKHTWTTVDVYASTDIYAADVLNMDNMRFSIGKIE